MILMMMTFLSIGAGAAELYKATSTSIASGTLENFFSPPDSSYYEITLPRYKTYQILLAFTGWDRDGSYISPNIIEITDNQITQPGSLSYFSMEILPTTASSFTLRITQPGFMYHLQKLHYSVYEISNPTANIYRYTDTNLFSGQLYYGREVTLPKDKRYLIQRSMSGWTWKDGARYPINTYGTTLFEFSKGAMKTVAYSGCLFNPPTIKSSTSNEYTLSLSTVYDFSQMCTIYELLPYKINYTYSGVIPANAPPLPVPTAAYSGTTAAVPIPNPPPGYSFSEWTCADAAITNGTLTMPEKNITITGSWIPHDDTAFTVEFYQQNMDDDGYIKLDADTTSGQGTTDTPIQDNLDLPALHAKYTGFHLSDGSIQDMTTIDGAGSAVLKLTYDRNVSAVAYSYSGETDVTPPTLPVAASYRYGQAVPISAPDPALPGYNFSGWETTDAEISDGSFTMPDAPVILTGNWTPRADTPYTVEYHQQNSADDGYTLAESFNGKGVTGANIPHREFEGFTQTPESVTAEGNAKIRSDGSTLVKFYYDRNVSAVAYSYSGETDVTPPTLPVAASYRYGQAVTISAPDPALPGYNFSGWETTDAEISDGSFTMPDAPVTLTGNWMPRADTPYTVEYYQQNPENDGYTLVETCNGKGVTGTNVHHREFEGFTQTPDSVTAEGSTHIASNGSTVLKLHYDRNMYTVTYTYSGDTDVTPPALPAEARCRYGADVMVDSSESVLPGYDFSGWETTGAEISNGSFTMPDAPVILTGNWTPRADTPYTVEYHQQNSVDDGYTLAEAFNGKGVTGTNVPHREFEGFTQTPDSMTAEGNAKITSDGSALLKLFYDRDVHTVAYAYFSAVPKDAPVLPEATSYRYGQIISAPTIPEALSSMKFSGWSIAGQQLSDDTFSIPAQDTVVSGIWSEIISSDDGAPMLPPPPLIQTMEDNGSAYIIGYEDRTFRPNELLTAKQEALMLSRLGLSVTPLGNDINIRHITRREFLSVLLSATGVIAEVSDPISQAATLGWVTGYASGEMFPDAYITRAQAVTILNRAFGRTATLGGMAAPVYADVPKDHWAYDAIIAASTVI